MENEIVRVSGKELSKDGRAVGKGIEGLPAIVEEAGANACFAYEEFFTELDSPHTITAYRRKNETG